jgi:phosphoribosylformylglycinamidine synthase subunit PurL
VVSAQAAQVDALLDAARAWGVPAAVIGAVGGDRITLAVDGTTVVDEALAEAENAWASAIGRQMTR